MAIQLDADEVAPGLWVGRTPPDGTKLTGIDAVVLAAVERQPILVGVRTLRCPLDDGRPTEQEIKQAWRCAQDVVRLRQRGQKVLVACALGKNRSAWVAAMVLMQEGMTARDAVRRIRAERRLPREYGQALSNPHFVRVLEALDEQRQAKRVRPHLQLVR